MKEELGINVMAFSCEGYKGVSQSAGITSPTTACSKHHRLDDKPDEAEFTMNILGEYNIGGDAWEIDTLLRKCGIHFTSTLSVMSATNRLKSRTLSCSTASCATVPSITSPT